MKIVFIFFLVAFFIGKNSGIQPTDDDPPSHFRIRRQITAKRLIINTYIGQIVRIGWKNGDQFVDYAFGSFVKVARRVVVLTCRLCVKDLMTANNHQFYIRLADDQTDWPIQNTDIVVQEPYEQNGERHDIGIIMLHSSMFANMLNSLAAFILPEVPIVGKSGSVLMLSNNECWNQQCLVNDVQSKALSIDLCENPSQFSQWNQDSLLCVRPTEPISHTSRIQYGSPLFSRNTIFGIQAHMFNVDPFIHLGHQYHIDWITQIVSHWRKPNDESPQTSRSCLDCLPFGSSSGYQRLN